MRILVIDSNMDLDGQLRKMSEETGISLPLLYAAWNEKGVTQSTLRKDDFLFDLVPDKIDHVEPEKRLSYQAQQKQLPKFMKRKKGA